MGAIESLISSVSIVCLTVCSGVDHRKHQSSASLDFVRRIRRWPVYSPHKGPVTRKMFPFDDIIMHLPSLMYSSWSSYKSTCIVLTRIGTSWLGSCINQHNWMELPSENDSNVVTVVNQIIIKIMVVTTHLSHYHKWFIHSFTHFLLLTLKLSVDCFKDNNTPFT